MARREVTAPTPPTQYLKFLSTQIVKAVDGETFLEGRIYAFTRQDSVDRWMKRGVVEMSDVAAFRDQLRADQAAAAPAAAATGGASTQAPAGDKAPDKAEGDNTGGDKSGSDGESGDDKAANDQTGSKPGTRTTSTEKP